MVDRIRDYLSDTSARNPYCLINIRLHPSTLGERLKSTNQDDFVLADMIITDGNITDIRIHGQKCNSHSASTYQCFNAEGSIVLPTFIDCHTHLDKGHILPRTPSANGSFSNALSATKSDREAHWSADDLRRRMNFAISCAYHHGTSAIRTHIDSQPQQADISWPVFDELRQEWQGRVELQAASLFGIDLARNNDFLETTVQRVAHSQGKLGAVAFPVPDLEMLLEHLFEQAIRHELDLDFHADESADPNHNALETIACVALRTKFPNKILVGHCCSLAMQSESQVRSTINKVADAGLSIVALPYCNLYLQDRRYDATTPRWRGMTLVHEMRELGIQVALGSDNTRDPFHAYGDLDMLDTFRLGTRILHLDNGRSDWIKTVTKTPAEFMQLEDAGTINVGGPANFILFEGRSWSELLSRPESDRIVIRNGCALRTRLPAYAELDA